MGVAIIDYDMGNVRSVANALTSIGVEAILTRDPDALDDAKALILPGVGAFGDGIGNIRQYRLLDRIVDLARNERKPLLGICLGMQLLADGSDEHGHYEGLGLIPGWVRRMKPKKAGCKVPHIGWNSVKIRHRNGILADAADEPTFYFVHSYCFETKTDNHVAARCDHGGWFAAVVQNENVCGVQFHPEKSQRDGIRLLAKFCERAGVC